MHTILLAALLGQFNDPHGSSAVNHATTYKDDVKEYFGTDQDYWWVYNSSSTQYELRSSDVDGIGTDGIVCYIDDGTDDLVFTGGAEFKAALTAKCSAPSTRASLNGVQACGPVTDAAPSALDMSAPYASPLATGGNQTGANYVIRPGPGTHKAVVTAASFVDNTTTFTVTIDGTANTGTEGTAFECTSVSNQVCADNIANWIEGLAGAAGVHACSLGSTTTCTTFGFTAVAATVYFFPAPEDSPGKFIDSIACSTGAAATLTNGTNGSITAPFGLVGTPAYTFIGDPDTGLYRPAPNQVGLAAGGANAIIATSATVNFLSGSINDSVTSAGAWSLGHTSGYARVTGSGGFQITGSSLVMTAGTFNAYNIGYARTEWIPLAWTNAMLVACGAVATCDITMATAPAKTLIKRVLMVVNTAATYAAGTLTMAIGKSAGGSEYVVAGSIKAAANTVYGDLASEVGASLKGSADATALFDDLPSFTGTTALNARIAAGAGTIDGVTTSTGTVYFEVEMLP